jgi:hypothetical protein
MNKKISLIFLMLILSVLMVTGCQPDNNNIDITTLTVSTPVANNNNQNSNGAYPPPDSSAYPSPQNTEVDVSPSIEPFAFKTSDSGKITVHGILVVFDLFMMAPDADDGVFLVPIPSGNTISTIPLFKIGEVPQAEVDERTGEFYFTNIEPGRYAVVVLTSADAQVPVRYADDASLAIFTSEEADRDTTIELDIVTLP